MEGRQRQTPPLIPKPSLQDIVPPWLGQMLLEAAGGTGAQEKSPEKTHLREARSHLQCNSHKVCLHPIAESGLLGQEL